MRERASTHTQARGSAPKRFRAFGIGRRTPADMHGRRWVRIDLRDQTELHWAIQPLRLLAAPGHIQH
eukprot:3373794-Alexandrium_andersonii.AAC.1